jgi:hypothetical protein
VSKRRPNKRRAMKQREAERAAMMTAAQKPLKPPRKDK